MCTVTIVAERIRYGCICILAFLDLKSRRFKRNHPGQMIAKLYPAYSCEN